jgi:hypothetical protein
MKIVTSFVSCGIYQLYALNLNCFRELLSITEAKAEELRKTAQAGYEEYCFPSQKFIKGQAYFFSDAVVYKNGQVIADFIKNNDLGIITEIGPWRNPNSGNNIKAWLWVYNGNKLKV